MTREDMIDSIGLSDEFYAFHLGNPRMQKTLMMALHDLQIDGTESTLKIIETETPVYCVQPPLQDSLEYRMLIDDSVLPVLAELGRSDITVVPNPDLDKYKSIR